LPSVIWMTEQELEQQIADANVAYQEASKKLSDAKRAMVETESLVIEIKIRREKLQDQLRAMRYANANQPPTERELEIEGFRGRMAEAMKKV
jgi:hypothetical protein